MRVCASAACARTWLGLRVGLGLGLGLGLASPSPNPNPNGVRAHRAPLEVRGVLMARVGCVGLARCGILRGVLQVDQLVALV